MVEKNDLSPHSATKTRANVAATVLTAASLPTPAIANSACHGHMLSFMSSNHDQQRKNYIHTHTLQNPYAGGSNCHTPPSLNSA
jgi:hypothetical protein